MQRDSAINLKPMLATNREVACEVIPSSNQISQAYSRRHGKDGIRNDKYESVYLFQQ